MAKEKPQQVLHCCECLTCQQRPHAGLAREHRWINRLVSATDERARRLLVGFLARQYGRGGIALLTRITGLDRHTIARGQHELQQGRWPKMDRIRRSGAGRPGAEKKILGS